MKLCFVGIEDELFAHLAPLKHLYRLDMHTCNQSNVCWLSPGSICSMLQSLREAHLDWPDSDDIEKIMEAPNLKHLCIDKVYLCVLPSVVNACHHDSAAVHVKAFSAYISSASVPAISASWDVAGLADCLRERKDPMIDWPGALIVRGAGSFPSPSGLQDVCAMNAVFSRIGQGIKKLIFDGCVCISSYDDVLSLAQAVPDVSELDVRNQNIAPHALKWMLKAWSVRLLVLSDLSLVRHLRAMRTKKQLSLRESLYVKVIPGAAAGLPEHLEDEFML